MPKFNKDLWFVLLRFSTLIGAVGWLFALPSRTAGSTVYVLLGILTLVSVVIYVTVASIPAWAEKIYRLFLLPDLLLVSLLIKYTGSGHSEFFAAYYLLIALYTYYLHSMRVGFGIALFASLFYLVFNRGDLESLSCLNISLRLGCLFLAALFMGMLSLELKQINRRLTRAIEREKEMNNTLDNKLAQITSLYEVSQALGKAEKQPQVHKLAVEAVYKLLAANTAYLMRPEGSWLRFVESVGLDQALLEDQDIKTGEGIVGKVFKSRYPIMVEDIQEVREAVARPVLQSANMRALICSPVLFEGRVLGVLGASRSSVGSYTHEDLELLGVVSSMIGSALARIELYENTHRLAITDPKTNLFNYRYFRTVLDETIINCSDSPISLLMLDLDHFKQINDSFGHHVGDQVLHYVASTFSSSVRSFDVVARFGGEEFIALLPECPAEEAVRVGERVRRRLEMSTAATDAGELKITASIGISTYVKGESVNVLLARVDRALYKSKELGRNKVWYIAR